MSVVQHLVKTALKHLANVLAEELRKYRIAVVAVTPGFLRSEAMPATSRAPGSWAGATVSPTRTAASPKDYS